VSDFLDSFARRLRRDQLFLASAMEQYARSERLNGGELAERIGVDPETLGRLGVCRRPSGETFARDVHAIAERFGADEVALAEVVRRADALEALCCGEVAGTEIVAAARDRDGVGEDDKDGRER
jgi:hypothetical protein